MPPAANLEVVEGFTLFVGNAVLSSRANDLIELAKTNLRLRRVSRQGHPDGGSLLMAMRGSHVRSEHLRLRGSRHRAPRGSGRRIEQQLRSTQMGRLESLDKSAID
jgi:hypothetical protein